MKQALLGILGELNSDTIACSYIHVHAHAGAEYGQCILDAISLACQHQVVVVLTHNDHEYRINPNELVTKVIKDAERPGMV